MEHSRPYDDIIGGYGSGYYRWILRLDSDRSVWVVMGDMLERRDIHSVVPLNITSYILNNYCYNNYSQQ